jgi:predicted DNA-binding ribbon-helix-helix protein
MAKNPRINVSIEPDTYTLLSKLAVHRECSMASLIRELIDSATPALQSTLEIMDSIAQMDSAAMATFNASLAAAEKSVSGSSFDALSALEGLMTKGQK